jgi:hypothetical protein
MCASAVAGNVDLTTERETAYCFGYYALFLITFWITSSLIEPGTWAMYLHDWFGNAALIFFILLWGRGDERRQAFVCLLIGGQVLSAYTHMFDVIALRLTGAIPEGMWRPHNILHTPVAALVVPLIALPIVRLLMGRIRWLTAYFFLSLGYFLHIFADTITYGYSIYLLWPLGSFKASLVGLFQRPDAVSSFLGNPLYIFQEATKENIDGFIVYRAEVAVNMLLAALFAVKLVARRLLGARS